ncbi:MAG TPA: aminotransferase class I/II-fold pyridoxal phosphate-dependent enzyme [Segeticoccus sp.]|uniref:pyridoxal phosphate-dependent aminotransferase n=1 Tax=Segeticoccus sp. TaxID=2706531 RepID=UPI002D80CA65|nr:aminotransferase class I/II-fold pyridoxal phosphate-dependent enzyme [Segeticoccus sp.]HET8599524.1 aminotransferase class I/II-fold pyridoxal phosphate-dependent enzyme [Segeticoccus sp.]
MTVAARPWLDQIEPYRPGRHAATLEGSMASNESPLGASGAVLEAVARSARSAHHYPDPLADELRSELAVLHDVDADQILVGNGSDELIYLLALAYLAHGGHAVCADPAYRIDEISTQVVGGRLTKVPLKDWAHDLATMARVDADVAYVVNPHNPAGTVRPLQELERFVTESRSRLVVVDEAYIDFADDPAGMTALPLAAEGRAAVLRTFSKIHGLAGMRVGYLVADAAVIATLRKIRAPFSVGTAAQAAALAALRDPGHTQAVRNHTLRHRAELTRLLQEAGYAIVPSQANFVLAEAPDESELVERLWRQGVTVRPGTALGMPGTVRVSVPSSAGLDLLRAAL